jgi:type IV pilus assembly protein PilA
MKTTMKKMQKGFSLVELMVVIAIIAILAAVAIPMYSNYTARAKIGAAMASVGGVKAEIGEAIANTGENSGTINITALPALPAGVTMTGTAGVFTIGGTDFPSGGSITLTPTFGSGALIWTCAGDGTVLTTTDSRLPTNCKS